MIVIFTNCFSVGDPLIQRDIAIDAYQGIRIPSNRADYDLTNLKKEFHMSDIMYFAKCGVEVLYNYKCMIIYFFFSVKPFNENNIINQMLLMCKKISEYCKTFVITNISCHN